MADMVQVIKKGNKNVKLFLRAGIHGNETYIPSSYLLRHDVQEGTLLCNTLSGELVFLSPEERDMFDAIPSRHCAELSALIQNRYLVPENCKEEETVEQIRALLLRQRENKKTINQYNILPTTACNARCFYCYESRMKHVHMTEETADQLVDYIATHHGNEKVKLHWFGGEPTLGKLRIDQICRGLEKKGIEFDSEMVSNAFLFDRELIQHARNAWRLERIQITLDGTETVYNRTKAYKGLNENAYIRVLRNIGLFLDEKIHVDIRLNLDKHNAEDLSTLIDELSMRFHDHPFLVVYVSFLHENVGFDPIQHSQKERDALKKKYTELCDRLEEKGWPLVKPSDLPSLRASSCMADDPGFIQCTPGGIISKCEDQIYENTIGTLSEGITDREMVHWWQQRTAFEECHQCPLFPSCKQLLKHCPVSPKECSEDYRNRCIARYRELMLQEYEKWKKNGN